MGPRQREGLGRARVTACQNAASAARGSAGEPVDMATLCRGGRRGEPTRLCIPSASPLYPASPQSPRGVPSQHGSWGPRQGQETGGGGGGVRCSQTKQNATHSGKITPAFTRNTGLSAAVWMRPRRPCRLLSAVPAMLKKATRKGMDAGKKTKTTPAAGAGVAEPQPEPCSRRPPRLSKGPSTIQVG